MKYTYSIIISIIFSLSNFSCNQNKPEEIKSESWDVKNTRIVESYDEVNRIAIKNAQDSLGLFFDLYSENKKNSFEFYIKSKFSDGKGIENMWSKVNSIISDTFFATLDNEPLKLANIKLGDHIKVVKENVEDWSIYDGDSLLFGNFIQRHLK